jgi:hypothetical protein
MSQSEWARFASDLQSNAALRAEAAESQAEKSQKSPVDRLVALASSKGYAVTAVEAREHLKAQAAKDGKVLSDADLDSVAGGVGVIFINASTGVIGTANSVAQATAMATTTGSPLTLSTPIG